MPKYDGLQQQDAYELFEATVYERLGLASTYTDCYHTLGGIAGSIEAVAKTDENLPEIARGLVWQRGDPNLRAALAVGSMLTGSWYRNYRRPHQPYEELLGIRRPDQLARLATATNDGELVTGAATVINDEYMSINGVPSRMVGWAAAASRLADRPQLDRLNDSIGYIRFSDQSTDSEESSDPHPVDIFLQDLSLPESFRASLLNRAVKDSQRTMYKSWVWQSRMDTTLKHLASNTANELRFMARQQLELPESDEDYALWEQEKRQLISGAAQEIRAAAETRRAETFQRISESLPARLIAVD